MFDSLSEMDWCASSSRCTTGDVKQKGSNSTGARVVALSALSAFLAPLVFVSVILLRRLDRRGRVQFRRLNKRMQHEISRWT
jgi:hypothetical protein